MTHIFNQSRQAALFLAGLGTSLGGLYTLLPQWAVENPNLCGRQYDIYSALGIYGINARMQFFYCHVSLSLDKTGILHCAN
jgi:hypothetical protein